MQACGRPCPALKPRWAHSRRSTGGGYRLCRCPVMERMPREGAVVVLRLSGNFGAEPGRTLKSFVFMVQLDLGDDEAGIVAPEHVHFPHMLAPGDD